MSDVSATGSERLKIAIACYPTVGGSGVVAAELGLALHARGHEIHFIATAPPFRIGRSKPGLFFHKVVIPSYTLFEYPSYGMSCACILSEVIEHYGVDVLHMHYAYPHAVSGFLARQMTRGARPAVVTTLHGTDIILAREQPCHERLVHFALEESHGVTAVSAFLRRETQRIFGLSREIDVIPNFVDVAAFRPRSSEARRAALASPGELLLVHMSNLRPIKRPHDVLATYLRVRESIPARLVVLGDGPELPALRDRAQQAGVPVDFVGNQQDPSETLAAADLFLLTSETEGFGLAALEAMACGVPVVSSRCGGIEEVVRDGVDGVLAPVGRIDLLAEACVELARHPQRRLVMAQAARQRAVEQFGVDRIVDAYERHYRTVLDQIRSGKP